VHSPGGNGCILRIADKYDLRVELIEPEGTWDHASIRTDAEGAFRTGGVDADGACGVRTGVRV